MATPTNTAITGGSPFADPHSSDETRLRLPSLYRIAGDLQIQMEKLTGGVSDATLTTTQIGAFNQLLADARALLPRSVALREDVSEVDATTRPLDVHHALQTTLVPTLHNALPPDAYERTG
jgi:hypothetical protein